MATAVQEVTEQTTIDQEPSHPPALQQPRSLLPRQADFHLMLQMADTLFKSGLLPDAIKSPQAAFAIIQKGTELGIPPMYALSNIHVIKQKPSCSAELMEALIYRDQGDNALIPVETTDEKATVEFGRRSWPVEKRQTFTFSMEDAKKAQLAGSDTWKKYPASMLRARCISAVARMAFADSIGGMYTPEELGADVTFESDGTMRVIDVPASEPQRAAPPRDNFVGQTKPTEAQKNTLESIGRDIRVLTGKDPETWKSLIGGYIKQSGIPAKSLSELTAIQAAELIKHAESQKAMIQNSLPKAEAKPSDDPVPEALVRHIQKVCADNDLEEPADFESWSLDQANAWVAENRPPTQQDQFRI